MSTFSEQLEIFTKNSWYMTLFDQKRFQFQTQVLEYASLFTTSPVTMNVDMDERADYFVLVSCPASDSNKPSRGGAVFYLNKPWLPKEKIESQWMECAKNAGVLNMSTGTEFCEW